MSTYFFSTGVHGLGNIGALKAGLDRLEQEGAIDSWHLDSNNTEAPLQIVTQELTPEMVKHRIRELGIDAEFTKPPETRADRNRQRPPGKP